MSFASDLHESNLGVTRAAHWLRCAGITKHGPGPDVLMRSGGMVNARPGEYKDPGDLLFRYEEDAWSIVEVKWLKCQFTGIDDWPFIGRGNNAIYQGEPIKRCIVDSCKTIADKPPENKPIFYLFMNEPGTHCGIIWVDATKDKWFKDRAKNSMTGETELYWYCPATYVEFYHMNDGFPIIRHK